MSSLPLIVCKYPIFTRSNMNKEHCLMQCEIRLCQMLQEYVTPPIGTLVESHIRTSSVGNTSRPEAWKLIGWMPEIFAEDIAWMPFLWKLPKKTSLLNRESPEETCVTFGLPGGNATLQDVTGPIYNHPTSTDGSGPDLEPKSGLRPKGTRETGAPLGDTDNPSPTTAKPLR